VRKIPQEKIDGSRLLSLDNKELKQLLAARFKDIMDYEGDRFGHMRDTHLRSFVEVLNALITNGRINYWDSNSNYGNIIAIRFEQPPEAE